MINYSVFTGYLSFLSDIQTQKEELKQRALDEYQHALTLPRKKKKKAKKSALLLYSVAVHVDEILDFNNLNV